MTLLMLGLVLFLGTHGFTILRGPRAALIAAIGDKPYRGGYSLLVAAGLALIVVGYGDQRAAGMIPVWDPPRGMAHAAALLMLPVFVLLAAPKRCWLRARTRHPMLLAIKLWASAHLLANGDLGSMLLFGGFLAWAVVARIAVKRREAVEGAPDLSGIAFGRPDMLAIAIGAALYVAVALWLHQLAIGVAVIGG
jgi:uncharacterized membrane protein